MNRHDPPEGERQLREIERHLVEDDPALAEAMRALVPRRWHLVLLATLGAAAIIVGLFVGVVLSVAGFAVVVVVAAAVLDRTRWRLDAAARRWRHRHVHHSRCDR